MVYIYIYVYIYISYTIHTYIPKSVEIDTLPNFRHWQIGFVTRLEFSTLRSLQDFHRPIVTRSLCVGWFRTPSNYRTFMYIYIYTSVHIYIYTYIHACIHTYIHIYIYICYKTSCMRAFIIWHSGQVWQYHVQNPAVSSAWTAPCVSYVKELEQEQRKNTEGRSMKIYCNQLHKKLYKSKPIIIIIYNKQSL